MSRKFTDEELSRVLTAHACGGLKSCGRYDVPAYPACIIQCACAINNLSPIEADDGCPKDLIRDTGQSTPSWFDQNYDPRWTVEEFLEQLREQGLA